MKKSKKPILVTGSHRSGTTWCGRMLAIARHTGYISEPFNIEIGNRIGVTSADFNYWFQCVGEQDEIYRAVIGEILDYRYPLLKNLSRARGLKDIAQVALYQSLFLWYGLNGCTPIVKDPIAFFSAPWLSQTFAMNVVVMIRHPAAFCSSIKIMNWSFDFHHFLEQPILLERYLSKFDKEIFEQSKNEKPLLEQAILLWNCIHHTVSVYREKYPSWLFRRHEDLSLDPIAGFRSLYEAFDLEFTDRVRWKIWKTCGSHNPSERRTGKGLARDSKANIYNWKQRLTPGEIDLIRAKTSDVAALFYSESDW